MMELEHESRVFRQRKEEETRSACRQAAFFILTGIDLADAMQLAGEERRLMIMRLERLLERERLKGARRHWSYDLNRHIALKQALDGLKKARGTDAASSNSYQPAKRMRRHMAPQI